MRNIRKLTRTMQLISTARFQASYNRATGTKPYVEKLAELVADISCSSESTSHPLVQPRPEILQDAMIIITSNRGLCGSYNANVLRASLAHFAETEAKGRKTDLFVAGKKGVNYFRFLGREIRERLMQIKEAPRFEEVAPIADNVMKAYINGTYGAIFVAYMRFVSVGQQRATVLQLLPLADAPSKSSAKAPESRRVEYEFSPEPAELLNELFPAMVRVRLFQCLMDATVSEHIARMVAMKAATDAAGDMITTLTRQYNRARQTHITMELLDIVGGANALT